jgi:hypothetical protein
LGEESRVDDPGAAGPAITVFVSDPTAEAEQVSQALRANGHIVVDVPQSMLVARVAVQRAQVVLVDADSEGALEVVGRVRELPNGDEIQVLFLARPGGAVASPEEAIAQEGNGLFVRPVDVASLVRRVQAVASASAAPRDDMARSSKRPPGGIGTPLAKSVTPSLPPASIRARAHAVSASEPPTEAGTGRKLGALGPPVSAELQQLLAEAENRVPGYGYGREVPSPEEEIEAVLPAELLAALDDPLDEGDDEDEVPPPARSVAGSAHGVAARERTDGGSARTTGASTTGSGATPAAGGRPSDAESFTSGTGEVHGETHAGPVGGAISTTGSSEGHSEVALTPPLGPGPLAEDAGARPGRPSAFPAAIGPGEAMRVVARAVELRVTGSLCFVSAEAQRRILLREGDVVTVTTTAADETLLAFLGVRGDLPKETVRRLASKFPAFGRHAGAALVARGYLRQDQMWLTLRAHAEWILVRILALVGARLVVEGEPPAKLAAEPSVFGGATGAEVFIELVRRILSPADAIERLGGLGVRLAAGPAAQLLDECALPPGEVARFRAAPGQALRDLLGGADESDSATVTFGLVLLGVLEVLGAAGEGVDAAPNSAPDVEALDAEAIRERIRARLQLVDDGDYFAVLGVARDATGYEIRRAFLELRRAFEPARVLTPELAELADDVRTIVSVIEEAYEILKDGARRERYRRAIEAVPEMG